MTSVIDHLLAGQHLGGMQRRLLPRLKVDHELKLRRLSTVGRRAWLIRICHVNSGRPKLSAS